METRTRGRWLGNVLRFRQAPATAGELTVLQMWHVWFLVWHTPKTPAKPQFKGDGQHPYSDRYTGG